MNITFQGMKDEGFSPKLFVFGLFALALFEALTDHTVSGVVAYWIGWTLGNAGVPFIRYRLSLRDKKDSQ